MGADAHMLVEASALTKRYAGVTALDTASIALRAGEVRGLVGPNGAGKSTLVKILTGLLEPSSGRVLVDGEPLTFARPGESLRAGIVSVPQELAVASTLTVAENVMLGHEPHTRLGRVRNRELRRHAQRVLDFLELAIDPDARVRELPLLEQRLVMIARALSREARLVILDEPTATVSPREVAHLLRVVRTLSARGVSILYVSHQLDEIETICDAVTVLRDGRVVAELVGTRVGHAELVELLAGASESGRAAPEGSRHRPEGADAVLEISGLEGERLREIDLTVTRGEIVALAGLAGSGARELLLTVSGAVPFRRGRVTVAGRRLRPGDTLGASRAGVGFLAGNRSLSALSTMSVRENVSLSFLREHARAMFVRRQSERTAVAALLDRVALRGDSDRPLSALSGGNQQRALVARLIGGRAQLLLLDDPTAGVDVRTRPEIYAQIAALRDGGAGALLVTTDIDELVALADRAVVFERGAISREFRHDELEHARLLAAMTGASTGASPEHTDPKEAEND